MGDAFAGCVQGRQRLQEQGQSAAPQQGSRPHHSFSPCTCFTAPFAPPHLSHNNGSACLTTHLGHPQLVHTSLLEVVQYHAVAASCSYCSCSNGTIHTAKPSCTMLTAANSALLYKQDDDYKDGPAPESYDKSEVRNCCLHGPPVCRYLGRNRNCPATLYPGSIRRCRA